MVNSEMLIEFTIAENKIALYYYRAVPSLTIISRDKSNE